MKIGRREERVARIIWPELKRTGEAAQMLLLTRVKRNAQYQ